MGKKSGREQKGTDFISNRLRWAHTGLAYSVHTPFDKLDFPLLVAGELEIIGSSGISTEERAGRVELLKMVSYNSKLYQWSAVRNFYEAILLGIERGERKWGRKESYRDAEPGTLYQFPLSKPLPSFKSSSGPPSEASSGTSNTKGPKRFYCVAYQQGSCSSTGSHESTLGLNGRKVLVEHFCRNCYNKTHLIKWHSEKDGQCTKA